MNGRALSSVVHSCFTGSKENPGILLHSNFLKNWGVQIKNSFQIFGILTVQNPLHLAIELFLQASPSSAKAEKCPTWILKHLFFPEFLVHLREIVVYNSGGIYYNILV